jgi:hypothetical protein
MAVWNYLKVKFATFARKLLAALIWLFLLAMVENEESDDEVFTVTPTFYLF